MILRLPRVIWSRWPNPKLTSSCLTLSTKANVATDVNKLPPYYRQPAFYRYFQQFLEENNFQRLVSSEAVFKYRKNLEEFEDLYEILENNGDGDDQAFADLARSESQALVANLLSLQDEIFTRDVIIDDRDVDECALEIKAGVGGKEASLFAEELSRLYMRFIAQSGWSLSTDKEELDHVNSDDNTSLQSQTVEMVGNGCYRLLRHEAGVHRVQRVPKTERYGRIHTSTVSISVIPIRANLVTIKDSDLKFDVKNSSGAGGQNVNRNLTCVRVTHLPTGHAVESQETRYQYLNKEIAIRKMKALLNQLEYDRREKAAREQKRVQVGVAARSDKIRTYNFPQNRITDHRLASVEGEVGSWFNINTWLAGEEVTKMREVMERLEVVRHRELVGQIRRAFEGKFISNCC